METKIREKKNENAAIDENSRAGGTDEAVETAESKMRAGTYTEHRITGGKVWLSLVAIVIMLIAQLIAQLLAAGTMVGVLFSLVTYESGSIWNSALMHGVWNMIMTGGILNIERGMESAGAELVSPFNYFLSSDSTLLTGGDFGIESSVIAIAAYVVFAGLAFWLWSRKSKEK